MVTEIVFYPAHLHQRAGAGQRMFSGDPDSAARVPGAQIHAIPAGGRQLWEALASSRRKLTVIVGSLIYVIESAENGFTSIIYWPTVTLTTVGYGDISRQINLGQMISAIIMIMGYGIIAVPTSIVTVELSRIKDLGTSLRTTAAIAPTWDMMRMRYIASTVEKCWMDSIRLLSVDI